MLISRFTILPLYYLVHFLFQESMEKKVVVGICAMAKKSNSKPMKEIIKRLENFTRLQVLIFDEDVILNYPVEDWPVVNAFISFFSSGFPLEKAIAYKNLRHPFVVNDLEMQNILQDRFSQTFVSLTLSLVFLAWTSFLFVVVALYLISSFWLLLLYIWFLLFVAVALYLIFSFCCCSFISDLFFLLL